MNTKKKPTQNKNQNQPEDKNWRPDYTIPYILLWWEIKIPHDSLLPQLIPPPKFLPHPDKAHLNSWLKCATTNLLEHHWGTCKQMPLCLVQLRYFHTLERKTGILHDIQVSTCSICCLWKSEHLHYCVTNTIKLIMYKENITREER